MSTRVRKEHFLAYREAASPTLGPRLFSPSLLDMLLATPCALLIADLVYSPKRLSVRTASVHNFKIQNILTTFHVGHLHHGTVT